VAQATARHVASALKSLGLSFDLSAANGLREVAGALPAALTTLPEFRITTRDAAPVDSKGLWRCDVHAAESGQVIAAGGAQRRQCFNAPMSAQKVLS
jgi:hypothetical protein